MPDWEPKANIAAAFPWEEQAAQYPRTGVAGISYFAGDVPNSKPVNCLLFRAAHGELLGILNHYDDTYYARASSLLPGLPPQLLEVPGNVNLWVKPSAQRKGIATLLLEEAERRWGPINWQQQRFTEAGVALVKAFLNRRKP